MGEEVYSVPRKLTDIEKLFPRKNRQKESGTQMALVRWLKREHSDLVFTSSPAAAKMSIGAAMKMKRMGYASGIPDLIIFEPCGRYHGLLLELKTERGRVSDDQSKIGIRLSLKGYLVEICYGLEEAKAAVENYLSLG